MSIPASAMEIGKIMDEKDLQPCFAALHIQPGNHRAFWEVIRSFIDTQDLDEKLFEDTSISAASREVHGEFKRSRTFNSIWKDPKWVDPAFVERLTNQGAEIRVAVEKELDVHLGKMWHFIFVSLRGSRCVHSFADILGCVVPPRCGRCMLRKPGSFQHLGIS